MERQARGGKSRDSTQSVCSVTHGQELYRAQRRLPNSVLDISSSFLRHRHSVTPSPWTWCRRSAAGIVKAFHWSPQWKTFGALDLDALILQFGCRQRAENTSKDDQNRAADGLHVPHPVSRALFVSLHYHFNLFYFILLISPISLGWTEQPATHHGRRLRTATSSAPAVSATPPVLNCI